MTGLLLHPKIAAAFEGLATVPPHGLLLSGEPGVGLGTLAMRLAERLGSNANTVRLIEPDEKGTIAIETVRGLYVATRTIRTERTVVVIDDADRMSLPAQNALLKLLEEPTAQTVFILTSHQPSAILPTVRSRVQELEVSPISDGESRQLLRSKGVQDATLIRQLLFLAGGRPALLTRLVEDSKLQERYLGYAKSAKEFIGGSAYQRVVIAAKLAQDREAALLVLRTAMDMLRLQLAQRADVRLIELLDRTLQVYERIAANGNVKAQLLSLSV